MVEDALRVLLCFHALVSDKLCGLCLADLNHPNGVDLCLLDGALRSRDGSFALCTMRLRVSNDLVLCFLVSDKHLDAVPVPQPDNGAHENDEVDDFRDEDRISQVGDIHDVTPPARSLLLVIPSPRPVP